MRKTINHSTNIIVLLAAAAGGFAQTPPGGQGSTQAQMPGVAVEPRPYTQDRRNWRAADADFVPLRDAAVRQGMVRAIVGLQVVFTPEGGLDRTSVQLQRDAIAVARSRVGSALAATQYSVLRAYDAVPAVALSLSPQAVDALRASGLAARIGEDKVVSPTLGHLTKKVEATETTLFGRTGAGQHIAILDTGIDSTHPFLRQSSTGPSKVVSEACFSNASCPNGSNAQTGPGAGAPCTYSADCAHGTHVAGIAAGKDTSSLGFQGVAPDAKLIAVQVFSNFGGTAIAYASDLVAALNHVYGLATASTPLAIAAVNMSLGGGQFSSGCDTVVPWDTVKLAMDNLRSVGTATVVATGNDSYKSGISAPACITTAIAVGGTNYGDTVMPMSNSSSQVDLLAPGAATSSITGGGYAYYAGTSMATPVAAGSWAVLKQMKPTESVAAVLSHLQTTGHPVTDSNNITTPRIRLLAASVRIADTGFKDAETFTGQGTMNITSNGVGLATRSGGTPTGTIAISGIPSGSSIVAAYLYWMTLGGPDDTVTFQGVARTGTLIGASQNSCWPVVNPLGPNRVYRASLPASAVPGNGTYTITGVGGTNFIDAQGASLVVVYAPPFIEIAGTSRVIKIRHGAMTLNTVASPMSHTFAGLSVPKTPTSVQLHVGMGDTEGSLGENSMMLGSSVVTPANYFTGSDGPQWDDVTIAVPTSVLPAGTTSISNSIGLPSYGGDCMAWAYSALSYKWTSGTGGSGGGPSGF
jgi:hypothetical protein